MMQKVQVKDIVLQAWPDGTIAISKAGNLWQQCEDRPPYIKFAGGKCLYFSEGKVLMKRFSTSVGQGFCWIYRFEDCEKNAVIEFETQVWIEQANGHIRFSLLPLKDAELLEINWPAPFVFDEKCSGSYTVLPMMQGCIIPNNWPKQVDPIQPPYFLERHAYMPWFGQIRNGNGCIAIADTPWDAGYKLSHPAGGSTQVNMVWAESMGKISYPRHFHIQLAENCSYVDFCKMYRRHMRMLGGARSLKEKSVRYPAIKQLCGAPVIHTVIQYDMKPEASCYDLENPDKNHSFCSFEKCADHLRELHKRGVRGAYVHLDGWGKAGYDQQHPDILPPCEKAGGTEGLRQLALACKELGFLLALHDQYRDYYLDAASYSTENSIMDGSGDHPGECTWNGGQQTYLCASLAPGYVRRNYMALDEMDIPINGAYLDVFSVMRLDECFNPKHPMTRKECSEYRLQCFQFIANRYGIVSSEEPLANTVDSLALCHHAPYATSPTLAKGSARGIPVPLFDLVYHDCIHTPWDLHEGEASVMPNGKSGFLYALLHGGLGYLPLQATEAEINQCEAVSYLNRLVAGVEMLKHCFVGGDTEKQQTTFANGVSVFVDFSSGFWEIKKNSQIMLSHTAGFL